MSFRFLTAAAFLSFFFIISNMALETPIGEFISTTTSLIPYGDKTLHLLIMAILSILLNGSFKLKQVKFVGHSWLLGSLLVAVLITAEECSQAFIPARNFDLMDLLCNYAGIYAGSVFLLLMWPEQHPSNKPSLNERNETISIQAIFNRTR